MTAQRTIESEEGNLLATCTKHADTALVVFPTQAAALDSIATQAEQKRHHILSVSTNLLYDAFYMPHFGWAPMWNAELEYYPKKGNWTLLAAFTSPYYHRWSKQKFFQIRDYHLEVRRYFKPSYCHAGAFLAGYVNNTKYGIGLSKTKGWQGEGVGAALKIGYVWLLCKSARWRLEASAAFGGFLTRYDPYVYGNPVTGDEDGDYYYDYTGDSNSFKSRNYQRVWAGPTEVALKLRYDLLYRRISKRGLSFKRKEVAK